MKNSRMPRGIRNNNPMNIRENHLVDFDWVGEHALNLDPEFEEFSTPEYGLRAGARILRNYRTKYGLVSVAGIINRWAPPKNDKGEFENDTASYIQSVSNQLGVNPSDNLQPEDYPLLMAAIVKHENGVQPYSMDQINTGFAMGYS